MGILYHGRNDVVLDGWSFGGVIIRPMLMWLVYLSAAVRPTLQKSAGAAGPSLIVWG